MTAARRTLPPRRPSATVEVVHRTEVSDRTFHVTVGYDHTTGDLLEVFYADGMKSGTDLRATAQDACILISLLLQHGATLDVIGRSLCRAPVYGEDAPASIIGAIVDTLGGMGLDHG